MMPPEFVAQQMATVLSDYGADGAKTGFIGQTDAAEQIAAQLRAYNVPQVVIDPVLVNHKGEAMFGPELTAVYQNTLFPLATLITPNRREAELLTGLQVETRAKQNWPPSGFTASGRKPSFSKASLTMTNW